MVADMKPNQIICGDALETPKTFPDQSVHCCVTSPPYWGLRDYGIAPTIWDARDGCQHGWGEEVRGGEGYENRKGRWNHGKSRADTPEAWKKDIKQGSFCQHCGAWRGNLGLEPTLELYVKHATEVFRGIRRVLRDDGTLWLNMGDSYTSGGRSGHGTAVGYKQETNKGCLTVRETRPAVPLGLKPKDLIGQPWRIALALQADGWYLRSDIIWHKPNPMPESATDRPTKAHEYLFLLTKSPRYFYDGEAVKVKANVGGNTHSKGKKLHPPIEDAGVGHKDWHKYTPDIPTHRNRRTVWTVPTQPYPDAHFATFPEDLIIPCIKAGCPEGGIVLDPFMGSGTTALVALKLNRKYLGIELNPDYCKLAEKRLRDKMGLFL